METKLVEVYFKKTETFYHSFEVPVDLSQYELEEYIQEREEDFWNEARSCQDAETKLDEISHDYFEGDVEQLRESGDYIAWEEEVFA